MVKRTRRKRKMNKAQLKLLSCAHIWGTVDRGKVSTQSLVKAEKENLIKSVYVDMWTKDQKNQLRKLGGYTEAYLDKQKKAFKMTKKGLNELKKTPQYKAKKLRC